MRNILLIVDMLNDFVHERGALNFEYARNIVPFIKKRLTQYRLERYKLKGLKQYNVIYVCDDHSEDDEEFKRFPKHAITGTWGAQVINELKPLNPLVGEKVIYKTRYNGFYNTALDPLLATLKPRKVEVVGVCTSICIMDTIGGLACRDYKIIVPVEGVADFDNEAHKFALDRMEKLYGVEVIDPPAIKE